MPKSSHQAFRSRVSVLSLRLLWQRLGFLVLALLASGMLVVGQIQPQILTPVRVKITDSFAPILDAMTRPADFAHAVGAVWTDWINVHNEAIRLRIENNRLRGWEQSGTTLAQENQALKALLNFHAEPDATSITARVIANSGGPFASSMIVTAGSRDGVRVGMGAVTADGLVGRVTEVGTWSARILLLTDVNARIPVMLQDSSARGILAGADLPELRLLYLPPDTIVKPGMRIVTSGHGGIFPPQIPVGVIAASNGNKITVTPSADLGRTNYVRLIDFNLAGGASNTIARSLPTPARP